MSAPLRVPLEVIERILFFALGGDQPLATPWTCVEPISPPVGTSHLLLVSKGVRELALPLYWRSITILRADDWIKLWGPDGGLLAGEERGERQRWIHEIRVNVAARAAIPIDTEIYDYPYEDDGDEHPLSAEALVNVAPVELPRLKHVCLFDSHFRASKDALNGRRVPGDDRWKEDVENTWAEGLENRLEHAHAARWAEEQDEDREQEWDEDEDSETFDLQQPARERALRDQRQACLSDLLQLDGADLETVRVPVIEDALSLMVRQTGRKLPRVWVYLPANDSEGASLKGASLDRQRTQYGFVGVAVDARKRLAAEFVRSYGRVAVDNLWRWVDEDGKRIRMV